MQRYENFSHFQPFSSKFFHFFLNIFLAPFLAPLSGHFSLLFSLGTPIHSEPVVGASAKPSLVCRRQRFACGTGTSARYAPSGLSLPLRFACGPLPLTRPRVATPSEVPVPSVFAPARPSCRAPVCCRAFGPLALPTGKWSASPRSPRLHHPARPCFAFARISALQTPQVPQMCRKLLHLRRKSALQPLLSLQLYHKDLHLYPKVPHLCPSIAEICE